MVPGQTEVHAPSKELAVFWILRESKCGDCGGELRKGSLLILEDGKPLCLPCADLDHLEYLPSGDAALTRRAKKNSALSVVVLRFSRARGRYERQGILVEESALLKAEAACLEDAAQRAARCEREEDRRAKQDRDLAGRMEIAIREIFPSCPPAEAREIAKHTTVRASGRVGRTAAGRSLEESAITAAAMAAIRHRHTRYDELLMNGIGRMDAREEVRDTVLRVLGEWRKPV